MCPQCRHDHPGSEPCSVCRLCPCQQSRAVPDATLSYIRAAEVAHRRPGPVTLGAAVALWHTLSDEDRAFVRKINRPKTDPLD
jgi:hypothetical protein